MSFCFLSICTLAVELRTEGRAVSTLSKRPTCSDQGMLLDWHQSAYSRQSMGKWGRNPLSKYHRMTGCEHLRKIRCSLATPCAGATHDAACPSGVISGGIHSRVGYGLVPTVMSVTNGHWATAGPVLNSCPNCSLCSFPRWCYQPHLIFFMEPQCHIPSCPIARGLWSSLTPPGRLQSL